jgi:hypothetical protein
LVNAYSKTYIPRVDQPYVTLQSLKTCASNELSVGLALLGVSSSANSSSTTNTLKTVLTVAKASYDTGNCWAREQENAIVTATNQKAVEYCESEGGVARSFVGNKLFCDMTEAGQ